MRTDQKGFALLPVMAIIIIVAIASVSIFVVNKSNNTLEREATVVESIGDATSLPSDLLSPQSVKEVALAESPNVEIDGIELKRENGEVLYKVKYANGSVVLFNAQTGSKVDRSGGTTKPSPDGTIPTRFAAGIDFAKALELAIAQKPDGVVQKVQFEMENGTVVYSVRFTDNARIDISATDGSITRNDPGKGKSGTAPNNNAAGNSESSSGVSSDEGVAGESGAGGHEKLPDENN